MWLQPMRPKVEGGGATLAGKEGLGHGLINFIDTKAKCRHLKKINL
jgi:hypothetical protein